MAHACVGPVRRISGRINMDCAIINDEKKLCTPVDASASAREVVRSIVNTFTILCEIIGVCLCVCMWIMLPVLHTHTLSNGNQSRLQKSHMPLALSHRVRCI